MLNIFQLHFQLQDAYKCMQNLSVDQAQKWVRLANKYYRHLMCYDSRQTLCRQRAIKKASEEVLKKYGKR